MCRECRRLIAAAYLAAIEKRYTQEDIMRVRKLLPLVLAAALGMSALAGCGNRIDANKVGATLDGEEISLGFMNFMAKYQQAIYDGQFASMFGAGQDMWSQDLFGEGTDTETSVKKSVSDNIEEFYVLEKHMSDYKVEITDEELAKMDEAAEAFMNDNSKKAIKQMGATKEYVKEMLRLSTIQAKMRDAIHAEVDTEVSDKEAAQKTISYVQVGCKSTTNEDGETVDYTDEEKENIKKEVEAFQKSAKKDFASAAETAGYTVSEASFGENDENATLDEKVIEAANKLKEGKISKVIVTDDNYYVVRMDSTFDKEATEAKKKSIVTTRKNEHYTEVCDGYKEKVKFELNEEEWAKVKFDEPFSIKTEESADGADTSADTEAGDASGEAEDNAADGETAADGADGASEETDSKDAAGEEDAAEGAEQ